jgi:replication factor C subunit 1
MIAFREGLKLQPQVVDQFVEGTHADIRQILNLLSTYRISREQLGFDESKKVYVSYNRGSVMVGRRIQRSILC